jgi:hypothetical protein
MGYTFTAEWIKGALNNAPDSLSRNPSTDPSPDELLAELDINNHQAVTIVEIRAIVGGDHDCLNLQDLPKSAETTGATNSSNIHRQALPDTYRRCWHIRAQLLINDDLIVYCCRLLIPASLHQKTLPQLHSSHKGMVRTKQRARLCVYWPGINNDIDNIISSCKTRQDTLPTLQAILPSGTADSQASTNPTIPDVLLRWAPIPRPRRQLLLRLARCHSNGKQHHHRSLDHVSQSFLLPDRSP